MKKGDQHSRRYCDAPSDFPQKARYLLLHWRTWPPVIRFDGVLSEESEVDLR
jgi:hypothetical protein